MVLKRNVEILNSTSDRPSRLEFRQYPSDLVAVDTVAAKIGPAALHVFDSTARYDLLYQRGYVTYLIVLFSLANVKCLIMNQFFGCMKNRQKSAADIFHMH